MSADKKKYVLGFAFDMDLKKILLICKKLPEWQAGKFNGIGGKVEDGESPPKAMYREFMEEASLEVLDWTNFARLHGSRFDMEIFYALAPIQHAKPGTDEPLSIFPIDVLPNNIMPNIRWLIEMALSIHRGGELAEKFIVEQLP